MKTKQDNNPDWSAEEFAAIERKVSMKDTETQVCRDILARQKLGKLKYGTTVAENPLTLRQWLQHAYEETLDNAVYLKRAMQEIDTIRQQEQERCIAIVYGQCSSDNEAQRIAEAIMRKA